MHQQHLHPTLSDYQAMKTSSLIDYIRGMQTFVNKKSHNYRPT